MGYTIKALARLSDISTRTLRYYDQIGLLCPNRSEGNGYRVYEAAQVDRLQEILFYRELGLELADIGELLDIPGFDRTAVLESHLEALRMRRERLDMLIANVERSIRESRGEIQMTDEEKFEGFKKKVLADNEARYGAEVRRRHGDKTFEDSQQKVRNMTQTQWSKQKELEDQIAATLKTAVAEGRIDGPAAQRACELHAEWLRMFWPDGTYTFQTHRDLAQAYTDDPRFEAYYENIHPGAAKFLRAAIEDWTSKQESEI